MATTSKTAAPASAHGQPAAAQGETLVVLQQVERQLQAHQFVEALTTLAQLSTQDMFNPRVWLAIGLTYTRMANWTQAVAALETALQFAPRFADAKQLLALALFSMGQQQRACDLIDEVVAEGGDAGQWMMRAYLHAHTHQDPLRALAVAQDWGRRFADPLTRQAQPLVVQDRNPRKQLKIGYVTADFRQHSVAFFMQPVLAHHNPEAVEVHVYSNGPADEVTLQMRSMVPHWHDVQSWSDEDMLARIRAEGIDVLVDLSGFTHGHRLGVFARRAAPVQVTWLGYMQTLGMQAMDYRLVDHGIAPASHAPHYAESLFYLNCMASYAPPAYAPLCEEPPMLRNGYPTLVSLNSSAKITDAMLAVWAQILHAREDARLIIMVKEENADAAVAHMQPRVEAAGMPLDRVSVLHQQPLSQFMEMGHIADIALDTSPISGGTTTLHALWMGLPIVTMASTERAVNASTAQTLRALGFGGEIAADAPAYVEAVLALMAQPERLFAQRLEARSLLQRSVLMDYAKRTAELEDAYRLMWINHLQGDLRHRGLEVPMEQVLDSLGALV